MANSLWGEEFNTDSSLEDTKKLLKKISSPKKNAVIDKVSAAISLKDRISIITTKVHQILGKFAERTLVIRNKDELHDYITKSIENGVIAIDTETNNSLVPLTCKLMGPCIYTPGLKQAYIPINHKDIDTDELIPNQLTEEDIKEEFLRLSNTLIIMHNGKFDYQVIKCTCGVELKIYWDSFIAARILNENEKANLKEQYISKIDSSITKYDIEGLFEGIEYAYFPPELFALYAATDAFMTYELYLYQLEQFKLPGHERLFNLFMNVEMPVVEVTAEMELAGISVDADYASRLHDKYQQKLDEVEVRIEKQLDSYSDLIAQWRKTDDANYRPPNKKGGFGKSKNMQLTTPINLASTTQFAIILYDILQVPVVDKAKPRGTDEEILTQIDNPLCKLVLEKRGLEKLLSTYIDKIPQCVLPETNRLHCNFLQIGADTGRFSSKNPNLQNIPSHNKEIRLMFTAAPGHVLCGSDFSQQEPRLLCQSSGDEKMLQAYKDNKDLYAVVASGIYKNNYEDNLEFYPDGSKNPDGAKRRGNTKSVLLGIMYQMSVPGLSEQINVTHEEAQKIIDDFYNGFPKVKDWVNDTKKSAQQLGYVEDLWGRRRRLPELLLPKYNVSLKGALNIDFNPLLHSKCIYNPTTNSKIALYQDKLSKAKSFKEVNQIKESAKADNIVIVDNSGKISAALRQCVNARIQGSAASMTKVALRKVYDNQELRDLGFKLVLQIHDELIGECPEENSERCAELLANIMKTSVADTVSVPFKCDADISPRWYYSEYKSILNKEYKEYLSTMTDEVALSIIKSNHTELTEEDWPKYLPKAFEK